MRGSLQALQGLDQDAAKKGIAQFIDDKSYRPGIGAYRVYSRHLRSRV